MSVRLFYLLVLSLLTLGTTESCKRKPTYPDTPSIEFARLERFLVTNSIFQFPGLHDSIVVTLNFKDGDGDLGMDLDGPPFSPYIIQYSGGNFIRYDGTVPYSCENYSIDQDLDFDGKIDTVLTRPDPHYNNYFIDILVKQSNGTYLPYTILDCGSINGRFPPLAPLNYKGPIEGSLSFTLNNTNGFKTLFENQTIKFRISIEDHALNKSNTIETSDMTLTY